MFDNLLYIFSKDTIDSVSVDNNYYVREVDKLNKTLLQKNSELQLLQRKYNKLLNHCIENELASKLNNKKRIESIIIQDIQDSSKSLDTPDAADVADVADTADAADVADRPDSPNYSGDAVGDAIYIRENNKYVSDNDEYEKI
jgi:hypothetical protein